MVICLEQGADFHMAQLMPLPLTVFLVPAHLGSPGQRAVKRVCVCVCVRAMLKLDAAWLTEYGEGFCGSEYRHSAGVNALGPKHDPVPPHRVPAGD